MESTTNCLSKRSSQVLLVDYSNTHNSVDTVHRLHCHSCFKLMHRERCNLPASASWDAPTHPLDAFNEPKHLCYVLVVMCPFAAIHSLMMLHTIKNKNSWPFWTIPRVSCYGCCRASFSNTTHTAKLGGSESCLRKWSSAVLGARKCWSVLLVATTMHRNSMYRFTHIFVY